MPRSFHFPAIVLGLCATLAACGGSTVTTRRTEAPTACTVETVGNDVTFVRDTAHGYGFSLPPPSDWHIECIEEDNRLLRAEHGEQDASVSVTADAEASSGNETTYLRGFMRDVRTILGRRGMQLTQPRVEDVDGVPIGVMEIRTRDGGETSLHVAAFAVLHTHAGTWQRLMVSLPSDGRFGHGDDDPMVRRAIATAASFGLLE